jgi:hypothetical protein
MSHSERFKLDLPDDFPHAELEAIQAAVTDSSKSKTEDEVGNIIQTGEWRAWAGGCNGALFRFIACDAHAQALASSLDEDLMPPMPERCRQESLLFAVHAEGQSAIECLYYGLYFVGATLVPSTFTASEKPWTVTRKAVVRDFRRAWSDDPLTVALRTVHVSKELRDWSRTRNLLVHGEAPPRQAYQGGERSGEVDWVGGILDGDLIRRRRAWLAEALTCLARPGLEFAEQRVLGTGSTPSRRARLDSNQGPADYESAALTS